MKLNKQEQKYRAKQQLANKFTQKTPPSWGLRFGTEEKNEDSVKKLVNRICK